MKILSFCPKHFFHLVSFVLIFFCPALFSQNTAIENGDILIEDFESGYTNWTLEGDAFGKEPASGKLGGQHEVSGFEGKGLVNSFLRGDASTGKMTSKTFKIERRYLSAKIGGGKDAERLYLQVIIDGKKSGFISGSNSEFLEYKSIDLGEKNLGKNAHIEIVDAHTGPWGHINIDEIVLSNTPKGAMHAVFEIKADKRYLHLPVTNDKKARPILIQDSANPEYVLLNANMELDISGAHDWICALDISKLSGKTLKLTLPIFVDEKTSLIKTSDTFPWGDYPNEDLRPQYHFSAPQGWLNDPNALIYFDGRWHMYYQLTAYSVNNGNKYWGWASSKDLLNWEHKPIALHPKYYSYRGANQIYSGTATADLHDKSGFFGGKKGIVYAFTYTGLGDFVAYSADGNNIKILEEYPITKAAGRDPCIFYFEKTQSWVALRYEEISSENKNENPRRCFAFYVSKDLKSWRQTQVLDNFYECPYILSMAVNGDKDEIKYIIFDARWETIVGDFDGEKFTQDGGRIPRTFFGEAYAGQLWRNAPDNRAIQISWLRQNSHKKPNYKMPFSQIMTLPFELELKREHNRYTMNARPVKEIESLYKKGVKNIKDLSLNSQATLLENFETCPSYLDLNFDISKASDVGIILGDVTIIYNKKNNSYSVERKDSDTLLFRLSKSTPAEKLRIELYIDRSSLEIIHDNGASVLSLEAPFGKKRAQISVFGESAALKDASFKEITTSFKQDF